MSVDLDVTKIIQLEWTHTILMFSNLKSAVSQFSCLFASLFVTLQIPNKHLLHHMMATKPNPTWPTSDPIITNQPDPGLADPAEHHYESPPEKLPTLTQNHSHKNPWLSDLWHQLEEH
jgi:hypothetical protein